MAHSTTRRILLLVLGALVLFCVTAAGVGAEGRKRSLDVGSKRTCEAAHS